MDLKVLFSGEQADWRIAYLADGNMTVTLGCKFKTEVQVLEVNDGRGLDLSLVLVAGNS